MSLKGVARSQTVKHVINDWFLKYAVCLSKKKWNATRVDRYSPAAYERDRRRLVREVDAGWRRCRMCDTGESHGADQCALTMGLLRGGVGDREAIAAAATGGGGGGGGGDVDGGGGGGRGGGDTRQTAAAAVTAVVNEMGNMALFDEDQWEEGNRQLALRECRELDNERALRAATAWASKVGGGGGGGGGGGDEGGRGGSEGAAAEKSASASGHSRRASQPRIGRLSIASKLASARGSTGVAEMWARADEDLSDDARGGLESLRLDRKNITEMPPLGRLPHLHVLTMAHNHLTHLPDELDQWAPRLERLRADHNALEGALADSVSRLVRLQVLQLDDNNLTALPPGLGALPALRELSAARNLLEGLPGSIGECRGLQVRLVSRFWFFIHSRVNNPKNPSHNMRLRFAAGLESKPYKSFPKK